MDIRLLSYPLFKRHAELVSASHVYDNERVITRTLKQVQGDVRFYDALRAFKNLFITKFLLKNGFGDSRLKE